jgi:hypothetical protein
VSPSTTRTTSTVHCVCGVEAGVDVCVAEGVAVGVGVAVSVGVVGVAVGVGVVVGVIVAVAVGRTVVTVPFAAAVAFAELESVTGEAVVSVGCVVVAVDVPFAAGPAAQPARTRRRTNERAASRRIGCTPLDERPREKSLPKNLIRPGLWIPATRRTKRRAYCLAGDGDRYERVASSVSRTSGHASAASNSRFVPGATPIPDAI